LFDASLAALEADASVCSLIVGRARRSVARASIE
jgi:hypothetical protein